MSSRQGSASGIALGVALGGFFDGILLHQILQWHHLLSLVDGVGLRAQLLWDGIFHAAMYAVALTGLLGLGRAWAAGTVPAPRPLAGALLVGFGAWHLADAVLSHWLLGIHRIRVGSDAPLAWDLGWAAAFGLLPVMLGLLLGRSGGGGRTGPAALSVLAAAILGAGVWAARSPDTGFATVVFRTDIGADGMFAALDAAGARLVDGVPSAGVVVVALAPEGRWALYRHGALLVGGTGPAGCLDWSRV